MSQRAGDWGTAWPMPGMEALASCDSQPGPFLEPSSGLSWHSVDISLWAQRL